MSKIDTLNTELESYVEDVEDLKEQISDIALGKGVSIVRGTDTPATVLTKIDNATVPTPSGTLNITTNNTYDVTNYSSAVVSVSGGLDPSDADAVAGDVLAGKTFYAGNTTKKTGTIQTYSGSTTITQNGTIATSGKYLASDITVNVSGGGTNKLPQVASRTVTTITADDLVGITTVGLNAFQSCTDLTSVSLPNTVTSLGNGAFQSCTSLTSVTLSTNLLTMGNSVFRYDSALKSITIPEGFQTIGSYTFQSTGLLSIVLPSTITSLGDAPFSNCTSMTTATILATTPPTLSSMQIFSGCSRLSAIYVPAGSVEDYKTAQNWSAYSSKIQAIPS